MDKQKITELIAIGYSHAKLAKYFSVSQSTVRYWLIKYEIKTNNNKYNQKYYVQRSSNHFCKNCGEHDLNKFHKNSGNRLCYLCKICWNKLYSLSRIQRLDRLKQQMVDYKGGKCKKCGYNKCLASLDFHHKEPLEKDPNWRQIRHRNFNEAVKYELDKCDLLCRNCHGEVHLELSRLRFSDTSGCSPVIQNDKTIRDCKKCGKSFEVRSHETKNHCSKICANQQRSVMPSKTELAKLLWTVPSTHIAKKLGVSDKAICKWTKKYELSKPSRGYWSKFLN